MDSRSPATNPSSPPGIGLSNIDAPDAVVVAHVRNFGIVRCIATWLLLGDNGGFAAPCKPDHERISPRSQSFGINQPRVRVKDLRHDDLNLLVDPYKEVGLIVMERPLDQFAAVAFKLNCQQRRTVSGLSVG